MDDNARPASLWKMRVIATALVAFACLIMAELVVRLLSPQMSEYPRSAFSPEYGFIAYPSAQIVQEVPGRWKREYSTNRYGHRGAEVPLSNVYRTPNVVVLGDSFSFGTGVDDGEEFPAVMRKAFAGRAEVVNLSSPGWGLAQEIRRFYELGQLYQPRVVVLQFCGNDPADDVLNAVTAVVDGRFVFRDSPNRVEGIKKYLSYSVIQKSQLYNLARSALYVRWRQAETAMAMENPGGKISDAARYHIELLETFARDLRARGVKLVMVAVPQHLAHFPYIASKTRELQAAGLMTYIEIMDWVGEDALDKAPDGGHWGPLTHRTIGEHLAQSIERDYLRAR